MISVTKRQNEVYWCRKSNFDEDREIVMDIWKRNKSNISLSRFDWLYNQHPNNTNIQTYILYNYNLPCGLTSFISNNFKFGNESFKIGIVIDTQVNFEHRIRIPAMILIDYLINKANLLDLESLVVFPNKRAETVFSKCGFNTICNPIRWARITDFRVKISKYISNRFLLDVISKAFNYSSNTLLKLSNDNFNSNSIIPSTSFIKKSLVDASFLYNTIYQKYDNDYINWRFKLNPLHNYKFFSVKIYLEVFSFIYFIDSAVAVVERIFFSNENILSLALLEFCEYVKQFQIYAISICVTETHILNKQLRKAGFLTRKSDRSLYGIEFGRKGFLNAMKKHLFMFDADMDI